MTGKKSLFAQYLTISLIIVLLSFVILGTMLVFFVARYSSEEKQSLLIENANQVADLVSEKTVTVNDSVYVGKEETEWITSIIETVSLSINADVFVTDQEGNTLLCSNKENCTHIKATIPAENFDTTNQKEIFISSDLGGVYESPHYVAVVPVTAEVGKVKEPVGFVIAATETTAFSDFTGEITKIFFYIILYQFKLRCRKFSYFINY